MSCCTYQSATFRGGNLTFTDISGNTIDLNLKYAEVRQNSSGFSIHTLKTGSMVIPEGNTLLGGSELTYDVVMNYVAAAKYYSPDQFVGYEKLTVSTSAVSLTSAVYEDAIKALIIVESGTIRWLGLGVDTLPTADNGMPWANETGPLTLVMDLSKFRMIRSSASDAIVSIHYMR